MPNISFAWLMRIAAANASMVPTAVLAQPQILSGVLSDTMVVVTKPAASPTVTLTIGGGAQTLYFDYQGPSGEPFYQSFYTPNVFPPTVKLQGYLPSAIGGPVYETSFNLYAEPGTWTLVEATVCSGVGVNCSAYTGTQLKSLFNSLTVTVINHDTPDITSPTLKRGEIVTESVSLSHGPPLEIDIGGTDNVSGIAAVSAGAFNGNYGIGTSSPPPLRRILRGSLPSTTSFQQNAPIGTYTVKSVSLTDVAGNSVMVSDPTAIKAAFHGHITFEVTP